MKAGMFEFLHYIFDYILGLQLTINYYILKLMFFLAMWGKVSFSVILSTDKQAHSQSR